MKHVRSVDDFKIRNPFRQGDKGYQYIEEKGQYREVTPIILRKREERKEKWPIQIDKEAKSFDLVSSILEHYEIRHSFYNNHYLPYYFLNELIQQLNLDMIQII